MLLSDPNARLNTLTHSKQLDPQWLHPCISDPNPVRHGAHVSMYVTLPSDHRSTGCLVHYLLRSQLEPWGRVLEGIIP